jgi:hypothetical protein
MVFADAVRARNVFAKIRSSDDMVACSAMLTTICQLRAKVASVGQRREDGWLTKSDPETNRLGALSCDDALGPRKASVDRSLSVTENLCRV